MSTTPLSSTVYKRKKMMTEEDERGTGLGTGLLFDFAFSLVTVICPECLFCAYLFKLLKFHRFSNNSLSILSKNKKITHCLSSTLSNLSKEADCN